MSTWDPDVCPNQKKPCRILTVGGAGGAFVKFEKKCDFHQGSMSSDTDLYGAIVGFVRQRERGRAAAKAHLGLDKERSVPYRMEVDGSFTLGVDPKGNVMPEWPTDEAGGEKIREAVAVAVGR